MAISSGTFRTTYTGNGAADTYAVPWRVDDETHLTLVQRDTSDVDTTLTLTTDYTVSGVGDSQASITLTAGNLASGYRLVILGNVPLTQETDLRNQGAYNAESVEARLDLLTRGLQQLREQIGRAFILPPASTISDKSFPDLPLYAGKFIRINADGDEVEAVTPASDLGGAVSLADLADTDDVAKGDAMVGFKHPGTGAVARSVHAKLIDLPIDIEDFLGGTSTGSLDNTTPLNNAIAYMVANQRSHLRAIRTGNHYYFNSKPADITAGHIRITGAGSPRSDTNPSYFIKNYVSGSATEALLTFTPPSAGNFPSTVLEHLSFLPGATASGYNNGTAVKFLSTAAQAQSQCHVIRVMIATNTGDSRAFDHGIILDGSANASGVRETLLEEVLCFGANTNGLLVDSSSGTNIRGGFFTNTVGNGYVVVQATGAMTGGKLIFIGTEILTDLNVSNVARLDYMGGLLNTVTLQSTVARAVIAAYISGTFTNSCPDANIMDGQGNLWLKSSKLQSFMLAIRNNAGTLEHKIVSSWQQTTAANAHLTSKVTGASSTFTTTPTGADASTAFAAGGKISSSPTNAFIFNTAAVAENFAMPSMDIAFNSTSTALHILADTQNRNVNGTTRIRPEILFYDNTGAAFALTTGNIAAGKSIYVRFFWFLA